VGAARENEVWNCMMVKWNWDGKLGTEREGQGTKTHLLYTNRYADRIAKPNYIYVTENSENKIRSWIPTQLDSLTPTLKEKQHSHSPGLSPEHSRHVHPPSLLQTIPKIHPPPLKTTS